MVGRHMAQLLNILIGAINQFLVFWSPWVTRFFCAFVWLLKYFMNLDLCSGRCATWVDLGSFLFLVSASPEQYNSDCLEQDGDIGP